MRELIFSRKFSKEYSLMKKRGKDISKLHHVFRLLETEQKLDPKYRDHKLVGSYEGYRDLHIEPDWLLIYRFSGNAIIFERTGTHSDLFKK